MKSVLAAALLLPQISSAGWIRMDQADISLNVPNPWKPVDRKTFPEAPSNVCFPRLQTKNSRVEAVIWKDAPTLNQALERYLQRLPRLLGKGETFTELNRTSFKAKSGVEGLRLLFRISRPTPCGLASTTLVRYIFHNDQGKIICLGGFGEINEIDRMVLTSLKIK